MQQSSRFSTYTSATQRVSLRQPQIAANLRAEKRDESFEDRREDSISQSALDQMQAGNLCKSISSKDESTILPALRTISDHSGVYFPFLLFLLLLR